MRTAMRGIGYRHRALAIFAFIGIASGGCTQIDNALASVPIFAFMRSAPSFDPYEHPLPAPPGSVPFESPYGPALPPLQATDAALRAFAAGPWGQNPFAAGDQNALAVGRTMYDRHCAVCHGVTGAGDGPLAGPGRFPVVPPVATGNALTLSDGYLFGIIRAGRGLMPAYGARMNFDEAWSIVTYVNQLQVNAGAVPAPAPAAAPAGTPPQE
jgi:mono/diheme cytochrome c family protein